jgi:hypothetical protein
VTKNVPSSHHIITVNEGSAIGLACGSYMATGRPSLVYLQVIPHHFIQICLDSFLEFRSWKYC